GIETTLADAAADALMTEQRRQTLGLGLGAGREQHAETAVAIMVDPPRDGRERAAPPFRGARRFDGARDVPVVEGCDVERCPGRLPSREPFTLGARDGRGME